MRVFYLLKKQIYEKISSFYTSLDYHLAAGERMSWLFFLFFVFLLLSDLIQIWPN